MTSQSRPFHQPSREIRSTPDKREPSFSYERECFLLKSEDKIEDDFHRRRGSFSRTSSGGACSSTNKKQRSENQDDESRRRPKESQPVEKSPPGVNLSRPVCAFE